jgi:hypothetical protein
MLRVGTVAAHVVRPGPCAAAVEVESETEVGVQARLVRETLARLCPQSWAMNAAGFPLLAMSAGPASAEDPGWIIYKTSKDAYTYDVDGNQYTDWNCGFGPHILGFNWGSPAGADANL